MRLRLPVLLVMLTAFVALAAGGATSAFQPTTLAGSWRGQVTDAGTSEGSVLIRIRKTARADRMLFLLRVTAPNLCLVQRYRDVLLVRGQGINRWNARGFVVQTSAGPGHIRAVYSHSQRTLTVDGKALNVSPTCMGSPLHWRLRGHFGQRSFAGTLTSEATTTSYDIALTRS
jgi:hypothetical protein